LRKCKLSRMHEYFQTVGVRIWDGLLACEWVGLPHTECVCRETWHACSPFISTQSWKQTYIHECTPGGENPGLTYGNMNWTDRTEAKYLLAQCSKVFDVDAGEEVRLGTSQRHHAAVVCVETMTCGATDVTWARVWRHTSVSDRPRDRRYNTTGLHLHVMTVTSFVSNFLYATLWGSHVYSQRRERELYSPPTYIEVGPTMHTIDKTKIKWQAARTGISPTSWPPCEERKENTYT